MRIRIISILVLCIVNVSSDLFAQNDTLVISSNELLIGEIKGFDEGVVTIETDYSDKDLKVEWKKVRLIFTQQKFLIITSQGNRYHGSLHSVKKDSSRVEIDRIENRTTVRMKDIAFLKQINDTFWSRLDLSLSVGYSLTKANNDTQFSGDFKTGYTSSSFASDLHFNALRSKQSGDDFNTEVSRTEGGLGFLYFIVNDWFSITRSDLLQSSEQLLNLRATTKTGVGNYIVKTNRMNLGVAGGIAWNYEDYDSPDLSDRNSAEAFIAIEYRIFDLGDLDFTTRGIGYPSLTEGGRFRTDFLLELKYEFLKDFFIKLNFTNNYDNQPVGGAPSNDYVLQTTLGWEL